MDPEKDEKRPAPDHKGNGVSKGADDKPTDEESSDELPPPRSYPPLVEYDD